MSESLGPCDERLEAILNKAYGYNWKPIDDTGLNENATLFELTQFMATMPKLETKKPKPEDLPPLDITYYNTTSVDGYQVSIKRIVAPIKTDIAQLRPALLYAHGGGSVTGKVKIPFHMNQLPVDWLYTSGIIVLAVSYRIGAREPYPAPLDDFYAAIQWACENANDLGIDRKKIGVMGVSAGGILALCSAVKAKDKGLDPPLAKVALFYPMLDPKTGPKTHSKDHPFVRYFLWTAKINKIAWELYLRREAGAFQNLPEEVRKYAEPLQLSCKGLPKTHVDVGTADLFKEEVQKFEEQLIQDGVDAQVYYWDRMIHSFEAVPWKTEAEIQMVERARQTRLNFLMEWD